MNINTLQVMNSLYNLGLTEAEFKAITDEIFHTERTSDQESIWGRTSTNVNLSEPAVRPDRPNRDYPWFGKGILDDSELYFPSCVKGFTCDAKGVAIARGPNWNGAFHSKDFGKTWQLEQVSDSDSFDPSFCRTESNCYYFANGQVGTGRKRALWFSRKSTEGNSWDAPKALTRTVPFGVDERYSAVAEGDTVHVCWLDNRHEIKYWLSLARSGRGNYEVACPAMRACCSPTVSWRVLIPWRTKRFTDSGRRKLFAVAMKSAAGA